MNSVSEVGLDAGKETSLLGGEEKCSGVKGRNQRGRLGVGEV